MVLRQRIDFLGELAAKRVIKQFAAKHHLVYFGRVDPREDEYELLRGLTVSINHIDNHYTVGTFDGRDLILVERSNVIALPGKPGVHHKWLIMQFDLKRGGLPHIFVDAHHHSEPFYSYLFLKQPDFKDLTSVFNERDAGFARNCNVYGPPHQYAQIGAVLVPGITGPLVQHFHHFDYEIEGDRLFIYASKTRPTLAVLQDMLRVGLWLSAHLDEVVIS